MTDAHPADHDPEHLHEFVNADSRGQALVLTDAETRDQAQISGRWLKSTTPVPVEQ